MGSGPVWATLLSSLAVASPDWGAGTFVRWRGASCPHGMLGLAAAGPRCSGGDRPARRQKPEASMGHPAEACVGLERREDFSMEKGRRRYSQKAQCVGSHQTPRPRVFEDP